MRVLSVKMDAKISGYRICFTEKIGCPVKIRQVVFFKANKILEKLAAVKLIKI